MRNSEPLRDYVASQKGEGRRHSEGEFTLDPGRSLEKMARFSLPFEGAWAVKVVQAVVASGVRTSLKVYQTRKATRFVFKGEPDWSFERVATQLTDPREGRDRSLYHLAQAFWTLLAAGEERFEVFLEGVPGRLAWNGELGFQDGKKSKVSMIEVHHRRAGGLFNLASAAAQSNVLQAISRRCFFCPMPLVLDGRRLDSVQRCPYHGSKEPLRFGKAACPPLELPPGSIEPLDPGVAFAFQVRHSPKLASASLVHWVLDGAVICSETLPVRQGNCSLGLYISAQGLVTDAGSFGLQEQLPKDERVLVCAQAVSRRLPEVRSLCKELIGNWLQRFPVDGKSGSGV